MGNIIPPSQGSLHSFPRIGLFLFPLCRLFGLFLLLDLLLGVLWLFWITGNYTMELSNPMSRDDILAHRRQHACTLDQKVRDLISQLCLRRRGCRAGASANSRRRLGALTSHAGTTAHADDSGEIPVVIGNRRRNRNVNKRGERTSVLRSVRRCSLRDNERGYKASSSLRL